MAIFIFILAGLILFNFIVLKLSIQSVDYDKKKERIENIQKSSTIANNTDIAKAA